MTQIPVVSVIMPAYNAARYIRATIDSVLGQSFGDFELLVIDDCSTDQTPTVVSDIAAIDARVRLIRLPHNKGAPAGPRNVGVRQARGEWIAFLDADDIWHPEKLRLQLQALADERADFSCTQMVDFTEHGALRFPPPGRFRIERIGFWKQLINFRTPTSSVVARRDLLLRHPFNEDLRYKAREDLDCWLHCYEDVGTGIKLRTPLLGYRIIPGQISGSKLLMFRRHLFVLRRYRRRGGGGLGLGALLFTLTHFTMALYHRRVRGGM